MPNKIIDVLNAFSVLGNVDAMQLIYNDLHFLSLNIKIVVKCLIHDVH